MSKEITMIEIGKVYPLFQKSVEELRNKDGSVLEAFGEGDGLWLNIYMNRPHRKEVDIISDKRINVRLLKENNYLLPMIRFGHTELIYELAFDPTLYSDNRVFEIKDRNNILTIILIDSSTGKVATIRRSNLPLRFIQECLDGWSKALLEPNYTNRYTAWYADLQKDSTERLWLKAEYMGKMGEVYNLKEVNFHLDSQFYRDK